ncbi:MAG: GH25 family lysozyme, partial [Bacteroidetes bacterium]|nr:GH25 family lysozyme [Bacteroidota bacterium]
MKKRYVAAILISILIPVVAGIIAYKMSLVPIGVPTPTKFKYPVTGIDVSKHTGKIDWNKIQTRKISFVYIKATEGETYLDPNYLNNIKGAERAKLK